MYNKTVTNNHRLKLKRTLLALIILCSATFSTASTDEEIGETVNLVLDVVEELLPSPQSNPNSTDASSTNNGTDTSNQPSFPNVDGGMQIHFIDVGQADATLFVQDGHTMLFDAATKSSGDELTQYIQNLGFDYIDVLVLTHPHDDHMGGAAKILNNLEVGTVYGPDIFSIKSLDTIGWYNDMLEAVDSIDQERNKGVDESNQTSIWHFPRDEDGNFEKFYIGQAFVEFYAPLEEEYSDLNDYSICAKVSFGEFDILLTGDATSKVEKDLLLQNYDLQSEVFHSAHHGSNTGNSKEFLEAINPENIVISCGMRNRYNHPVESVMDLYEKMNVPVYRTDESGNIVLTTDGTTYSFNTAPGTYISGAEYNEKGE